MPGIPEPLGCSAPGQSPSVPSHVCLTVAPFGPSGAQPLALGGERVNTEGAWDLNVGSLLSRPSLPPATKVLPKLYKASERKKKKLDPQPQVSREIGSHT